MEARSTAERSTLYDLFTGAHEYDAPLVDRYGRVPYYTSPHRDVFGPVVSAALHAHGFRPHYPGGHPFAVCLSHDLDLLLTSRREKLGTLRRGGLPADAHTLRVLLKGGTDPRYSVEHLLAAERSVGAASTFHFMALEPGEEDHNYTLPEVADQIAMVRGADGEIALHGGHTAHADEGALLREKSRLELASGLPVTGYRNHFLRFQVPGTWHLLERHGFVYDSTYGHSDCAGFRNGMCHPFRPVDRSTAAPLGIVEVPLVLMDAALFFNMKLTIEDARQLCHRLIAEVRAVGGVVTLLWHNNYMQGAMGALYRELLAHLAAQGAWFTRTADLVEHWTSSGLLRSMEAALHDIIGSPHPVGAAP